MRPVIFILTCNILLLTGCKSNSSIEAVASCGVDASCPNSVALNECTTLDCYDIQNLDQCSPRTINKIERNQQLSLNDVKIMAQAGLTDDKIINTIYSTGSVYHLSTYDVEKLKKAGVSECVIDYMLATAYE